MRKLLIALFILSSLCNCVQKKSEESQPEIVSKTKQKSEIVAVPTIKTDTIKNYWALILDTISSKKEFKIDDFEHILKVKTYSLNDSSIVRNLSQNGEPAYLDHSHKMVTDLELIRSAEVIDTKQIDRTDFEQALFPEFYAECNLFSTVIDSIIENKLYLATELAVPDTDNHWKVWYTITIESGALGNLDIRDTDYVGL
jgi:hypothetical protein